jgi:photosystem II stability/assembly factor-like uncharacterized protein
VPVPRTGQFTRVATSRDGGVVYMLDSARLHRSSDHGSTWQSGNPFPFPDAGIAYGIAVHSTDPSIVWVGVFGNGILMTRDAGLTWQVQSTDPNILQTFRLEVDPTNPDCLWASSSSGIFRSLDEGATWESRGPSGYYTDLDIDPSGEMYATEGSGTVIRSTDGGAQWTALSIRFGTHSWPGIAIDPQDRHRLIGFGGTGVWLSANSGTTWLRGNTGLHSSWITSLARVDGTTRVYVATGENGAHRLEAPDRIAALNNSALAAASANVQSGLMDIVAASGAGGFDIVVAQTTAGELVRSLDGGTSWTRLSLPVPRTSAIALSTGAPRILFAAWDTVYTSTDFGNTWIPSGAGLPSDATVARIALSSDPRTAYVLVASGNPTTEFSVFNTLSVSGNVTSDEIDPAAANDSATLSASVTAPSAPRDGGGGGGAMSLFFLLALGLAGASRRALC